jgi:hypothetical protein
LIPGKESFLSLLYSVQNVHGTHPVFCTRETGGSSLKIERPGREAEVRNNGVVLVLSHTS